jgi:hypothetical protein
VIEALIVPPTHIFPPTPNPPAIVTAPVIVELAIVVAVTATDASVNCVLVKTPLGGTRVKAIGHKSSHGVFMPLTY